MPAIDRELWIIDRLLRDLKARWTRSQKSAAPSPIKFRFRLLRARDQVRQIEPKQVVTFDDVGVSFLDQIRQALNRSMLGVLDIFWIDNDEFFPAAVIGKRDAHDVIGGTRIGHAGYRLFEGEHFELQPFQFFERQTFEQRAPRRGEIMLHRIGEGEEIAPGVFETVAQRDQFLPTVHCNSPAVFEIAS